MPHVELSITDLGSAFTPPPPDPLTRWAAAVTGAVEPSLVIDAGTRVVAMSPSCVVMLGLPAAPLGQPLRDGALRLIDFNDPGAALTETEVGKIPPLLSLSSGRLARGLIRVHCPDTVCTLDAVATPIGAHGSVVGSLTFFSPV